jgi:capsular polysaccharide biosynthesis protein
MELWEYTEVLIRWGWVIILVTAICVGAAFGLIKLQTPRYTSAVEVDVTPARLDLALSQPVVNLLRNYVSNIESEGMARRVIERMALSNVTAEALQRKIGAEANESEFRLTIEVTDTDPIFAQRVAQTTAQLLVEDVQDFASRQDPQDRLIATLLNGGAQPAGQTWPRKKLLAFLGAGGGLVLGLLVALALEWSRVELIQTPEEVEAWLGLPVLGSIPGRNRRTTASRSILGRLHRA